jgi:hypothetical protein
MAARVGSSSLPRAVRNEDELRIAHLYRRAGFGLAPDELEAAKERGLDACITELVHPEKVKDPLDERLAEMQGELFDLTNFDDVQAWWLYRMIHTRRPLVEKMTLFWHGHSATANSKVDNPRLMLRQNQCPARRGARQVRRAPARHRARPRHDPVARQRVSSKAHPNENFGRELLSSSRSAPGTARGRRAPRRARLHRLEAARRRVLPRRERPRRRGGGVPRRRPGPERRGDRRAARANPRDGRAPAAAQLVRFFVADEGVPALEQEVARTYLSRAARRACVESILRSPRS